MTKRESDGAKDGAVFVCIYKATPYLLKSQYIKVRTLGSVIFVSPLKSMDCTGLETNFEKTLSNDFKRLGEK
jgi:hypothetical protein